MRNTAMHKQSDFLIVLNDRENLGEWAEVYKLRVVACRDQKISFKWN